MNPFERLGLEPKFSIDLVQVERVHRELSRALHPDRHVRGLPSERVRALDEAVSVNEAWRTLRDPIRRAEAILELRGSGAPSPHATPSPGFLMAMMERREDLEAAKHQGITALQAIEGAVARDLTETLEELAQALDSASAEHAPARRLLAEVRFHQRLLDEVTSLISD